MLVILMKHLCVFLLKYIGAIKSPNIYTTERHNSGRGRVTVFHYQYEWIKYKKK